METISDRLPASTKKPMSARQIALFAVIASVVLIGVVVAVLIQNGILRLPTFGASALDECRKMFERDSEYPVNGSDLFSYGSPHRENFSVIETNWYGTITVSTCIEHENTVYVTGFARDAQNGFSFAAVFQTNVSPTPVNR